MINLALALWGLYWDHLRNGSTQPNLVEFPGITFTQGQAVRIRLVTFL
jgi:hypothetical protein